MHLIAEVKKLLVLLVFASQSIQCTASVCFLGQRSVIKFVVVGNLHEVMVELEGISGGGKIYLEVKIGLYA